MSRKGTPRALRNLELFKIGELGIALDLQKFDEHAPDNKVNEKLQ